MKKSKKFPVKLNKCPYLLAIVLSALIVAIYGVLLNFGVIKPKNEFETPNMTDIAVASAVHNIKAYFSPDMDYEPVKFVPPEENGFATASSNAAETVSGDKQEAAVVSQASAEAEGAEKPGKDEEDTEEEKADEEASEEEKEDEDEEVEEDDGSYSPYGEFVSVDDDYFDERTAIIGDSRTK
ncbi:MAG: hypothetical protein IJU93_01950, partial [Lachnospiraceae bacterium]|nr:hypothetical protein [Lachnospiraceae bacterium]